ncbi:Mob protein [Pacificibacter sp.]|uniref:Mob protein n=1 Tax=Pacificibacter sp. TaxID=1917866 RepID=UPI00321C2A7F
MAYQFIHIETYSTAQTKVKGTDNHFNSAAQVFGEARRVPKYSGHVEQVGKVYRLGGTHTVSQLEARHTALLKDLKETVTRKDGSIYERKLRKDAATLYTEIHSHPLPTSTFLADKKTHGPEIQKWIKLALEDFQARMPGGIEWTAVMHVDESHVHFHILAINPRDPKLDANKLHTGKAAAAKLRNALDVPTAIPALPKPELQNRPKKPKQPRPSKNRETQRKNKIKREAQLAEWEKECRDVEADNAALLAEWKTANTAHLKSARKQRGAIPEKDAYTAAMKALQDRYYEQVGKPCGLLRDGPRSGRLTTVEYATRKKSAQRLAANIESVEKDRDRVDQEIDMVEGIKATHSNAQEVLAKDRAELDEGVKAIATLVTQLETGEATISGGTIQMQKPPSFLKRLFQKKPQESSATGLFRRLVKLIARGVDGDRSVTETTPTPNEPEF